MSANTLEVRLPPDDGAGNGHLDALGAVIYRYPGAVPVVVLCNELSMELGPEWRVDGSPECLEAIMEALA